MDETTERQPLTPEQAVIGAALAGPAAHEAILALVDGDFTDSRNATVAAVIRDMIRSRRGIDPGTVIAELSARGQTSRLPGGSLYVHRLYGEAPPPVMAMDYAAMVRAAARVRRHTALSAEMVTKLGMEQAAENLDELLAWQRRKQAEIPGDLVDADPETHTLEVLMAELDKPTDWLIPGLLERGERVVITGHEGRGKRLRVDEPIPVPSGWTTMGALRIGDEVFDRHGKPCRVTGLSEIDPFPDSWTVVFDDGTEIEADAEHQWVTVDYSARQRDHGTRVHTTAEIRETLQARGGHTVNHAIPVAGALETPDADLPVPPYTLGAWLGDGTSREGALTLNRLDADGIRTVMDSEGIRHHEVPSGDRPGSIYVRIEGGNVLLRNAGLLEHKHIPERYLRASIDQRTALLAGLMDTDGTVTRTTSARARGNGAATCEITLTCKTLIPGVLELIRTLGIKAVVSESDATLEGRVVGRRWRIRFQSPFNPFRTPRKADRWVPLRTRRAQYRYIVDVRRAEPTPMRCIAVDSPDHTYLAGRRMVPTHNSVLMRQIATCLAAGVHPWTGRTTGMRQCRVLHVDVENSRRQIRNGYRMVARIAGGLPKGWARNITIHVRPDGADLPGRDAGWFHQVAAECSPDAIIIGPAYKLMLGDPQRDRDVLALLSVLDEVRVRHDAALIIEHHSPHGDAKYGPRTVRPYGSSVWLRWPEVGMGLKNHEDEAEEEIRAAMEVRTGKPQRPDHLDFDQWRPAREDRDWPAEIVWGAVGEMPWKPAGEYVPSIEYVENGDAA